MEVLTDDEYFSLDVYLPGFDVALEVDGPSHFAAAPSPVGREASSSSSSSSSPSSPSSPSSSSSPSPSSYSSSSSSSSSTSSSGVVPGGAIEGGASGSGAAGDVSGSRGEAGGGEGGAPGASDPVARTTRTMSTELRDLFLAKRHRAVVSVPWFELDGRGFYSFPVRSTLAVLSPM